MQADLGLCWSYTSWCLFLFGEAHILTKWESRYDLTKMLLTFGFKGLDMLVQFMGGYKWLIVLGFNGTWTIVGHFVLSPREGEKRDRRDSRGDERKGHGRKINRNESEKTEEIKTLPLYPHLLQGGYKWKKKNNCLVDFPPFLQRTMAWQFKDLLSSECKVLIDFMTLQWQYFTKWQEMSVQHFYVWQCNNETRTSPYSLQGDGKTRTSQTLLGNG